MCGILCLLFDNELCTPLSQLYTDCKFHVNERGPNYQNSRNVCIGNKTMQMFTSVLWLQGDTMTKQPIETSEALFAYNGDVFGGAAIPEDKKQLLGDTGLFLENIHLSDNIIQSLLHVHGPYAFVYYDKVSSNLYFGRDVFGRRSLLLSVDKENNALMITSVAVQSAISFIEVPAIGIFSYNLLHNKYVLHCWPRRHKHFDEKVLSIQNLLGSEVTICASEVLQENSFVLPRREELMLFDCLKDLTSVEDGFNCLLKQDIWKQNVITLHNILENALRRRISTQPKYCKDCLATRSTCKHCRVGILFSGGVDCTILALLADKFIDPDTPIDLLNVAFDRARDYETPDRLTGLQSLEELRHLRPKRNWHFVAMNVSQTELDQARASRVANLIYPLNTVLDDSLGCALWFASRGRTEDYVSPCRVVLVGMGADELFGGYARHRAVLKAHGWRGLNDALEEDWANIAHRNLARDDRVVADHGRQLRTPYLDEEVVAFVQSLPVWEKTYPSSTLPQGFGEKILLRALAYSLGLRRAASLKKRALQFGSRIADRKENAHQVSPRLIAF